MTLEIVESRLLATLPEAIHQDIEGISREPFESYPAEIEPGESPELRWDVSGAPRRLAKSQISVVPSLQ